MKRTAWIAFALVTITLPASGEPGSDPGEILALLQSERPVDVAWGAYRAGEGKLGDAAPLLVDRLRPHPERESVEWSYARWAVMDALIRLEATVPGDLLLHHANGKGWRKAVILLAADPIANRAELLTLFRRARPEHLWNGLVAIGNLLGKVRAPGFAGELLSRIPFELRLTVRDPEDRMLGGGARRIGVGRGDGLVRLPDGFPPYAHYHLWTGRVGGELLAHGPHPVYWTRREFPRGGLITGVDGARLESRTCSMEWLAGLLDRPVTKETLPETLSRTIRWRDPEDYLERATAARDALLAPWRELVVECLRAGLVTREEARSLRPRLEVVVSDKRAEPRESLPELPADEWRPPAPEDD
jgi:hypothetical protein